MTGLPLGGRSRQTWELAGLRRSTARTGVQSEVNIAAHRHNCSFLKRDRTAKTASSELARYSKIRSNHKLDYLRMQPSTLSQINKRPIANHYQAAVLTGHEPDRGSFLKGQGSRLLRKARSRSREKLIEEIGKALEAVSSSDARGFFGHSGYRAVDQTF